MGGNFLGGAVALLYFLMFQLCGVTLAACFLNKERRYTHRQERAHFVRPDSLK